MEREEPPPQLVELPHLIDGEVLEERDPCGHDLLGDGGALLVEMGSGPDEGVCSYGEGGEPLKKSLVREVLVVELLEDLPELGGPE